MAFLLDTNAWIVYLKRPSSKIRDQLQQIDPDNVFFCSVVKAELLHGARKFQVPERREAALDELFRIYASVPFDDRAAILYANERHTLEVNGEIIGPHDLMIAAIAKAHQMTLVTHNTKEFSRVPGLMMVDWEL